MNETALKERLRTISKTKGITVNEIWKQLILERFLARLSLCSPTPWNQGLGPFRDKLNLPETMTLVIHELNQWLSINGIIDNEVTNIWA